MKIEIEQPKGLIYRVALRFIRVFVAGAIAQLVLLPPLAGLSYGDFRTYGIMALNAVIIGGLTALDKLVRQ